MKMGKDSVLALILGIAESKANAPGMQPDRSDWFRVKDICEAAIGVESGTADEKLTGPESSREEVAGISTRGSNTHFSNSGMGGGSPERVAPA